jgi:rhodanese-related sulfurtransferase
LLIAEEGKEDEKYDLLIKAGFENIEGYLKDGFATWHNAGNPLDVALSIDSEEMMLDIKFGEPRIVDIRPKASYDFMHLATADNVQASKLINHIEELPRDDIFYLYDEDGETAMFIVSWLKKHGHHNYYHIKGGYKALLESEAIMNSNDKPVADKITKLPPEQLN